MGNGVLLTLAGGAVVDRRPMLARDEQARSVPVPSGRGR